MSLQVWLPLNGDLNNQGLSGLMATNSGATVNNNGKIGKCYQFGTASSYMTLPKEAMTSFTTEASVCFWLKIISWNTSYATYFQAGLGSSPWTNYIFALLRNNANSTCCFTISNGSNASNASYLTPALSLDTWYHIALVYKTGHCLIYINGSLHQDYTTSIVPNFAGITKITLGTSNATSRYQTNCLMNDVRIYDHALSKKEIEEIAKGLVLHYKLDAQNLINKNTLITGKYLKGSDGASVTHASWCYTDYIPITPGKIYLGVGLSSSGTVPGIVLYNASKTKTRSMALTANQNITFTADTNEYYVRLSIRQETNLETARFYETPTTIYDCSGYNNNGTIIGSLYLSSIKSPRYEKCTHFNGTDNCIIVPYNSIIPHNIFTCNVWFYKDAIGTKNYESLFAGPSGFEMDTRQGSAEVLKIYMASTRGGAVTGTLNFNTWYMVTMVRDGTNEMYYINGELVKTIEAKSMPTGTYRIGAWNTNTSQNYYGEISDFRLYATPLSATAIKELYDTSASIDASGNVYARELKEV